MDAREITIEIRLGADVIIKSKQVRAWFVDRLVGNIKNALGGQGIRHTMQHSSSCIFLRTGDPAALVLLKNIFGISTFSVIEHQCPSELETIIRTGTDAYKDDVKGKTFGIRTKRRAKLPFRSNDINCRLGDNLNAYAAGVDLDNPEFAIFIDVDKQATQFYTGRIPGAGGLPLGVSGHAVCLFSGGFDSPVAAWSMLKRGVKIDYVFCNLAGESYRRNVLRVGKIMAEYWHHGCSAQMHIVDFQPVVEALKSSVEPRVIQVVLKRLFYRAADLVARKLRASAIITGEALGQVSSQTLENFCAIQEVTPFPLLRPLVGMDKQEIVDLSKKIGTYHLSAHIKEYCQLTLGKTHTRCPLSLAVSEEQKIPQGLISELVNRRETLNLRSLTEDDLNPPGLFIDHIPPNAVIFDCRSETQFRQWRHPDALTLDIGRLLKDPAALDKNKCYILYCPFGAQSAAAAEELRQKGLDAYSFRGGTKAMRSYTEGLIDRPLMAEGQRPL